MLPSWHLCVTMHMEYCQPGKLTRVSVSRVFNGASLCRHDGLTTHMAESAGWLTLHDTAASKIIAGFSDKSSPYPKIECGYPVP